MAQKRRSYNTYTKAFKEEAVKLMLQSDRPSSEIAMELGVRRNQLYKWKEQLEKRGNEAFSGRGRPKKEDESETARLRRKVAQLEEENTILKKAAVFFARELK